MWIVGVGLLLNLLASVVIFSWLMHHEDMIHAAMFFVAFLCVWAFAIGGFIALIAGRRKLGAALVTLGSLIYVPVGVGLVAIAGAIRLACKKPVPSA